MTTTTIDRREDEARTIITTAADWLRSKNWRRTKSGRWHPDTLEFTMYQAAVIQQGFDRTGHTHMNVTDIATETADIEQELFTDDVYRARQVFNTDQQWFDVGSHVGLFTRLAQENGASVIGAVDIEPDMVRRYSEDYQPPIIEADIRNAVDIINALRLTHGDTAIIFANALKLDIQGAETDMLQNLNDVRLLADQFDFILFEYHEPHTLPNAVATLEEAGYQIEFINENTDALSGQPTDIVFATKP